MEPGAGGRHQRDKVELNRIFWQLTTGKSAPFLQSLAGGPDRAYVETPHRQLCQADPGLEVLLVPSARTVLAGIGLGVGQQKAQDHHQAAAWPPLLVHHPNTNLVPMSLACFCNPP
jgi:hypothetical protein